MAKRPKDVQNQIYETIWKIASTPQNYLKINSICITKAAALLSQIELGQPYRFALPRLCYVKKGSSTVNINFVEYHVGEGDFFITPAISIFTFLSYSKDYSPLVMSFDTAESSVPFFDIIHLKLSSKDRAIMEKYFELAEMLTTGLENNDKAMESLFLSLFSTARELAGRQSVKVNQQKKSASQELKDSFFNLLTSDGGKRHDIYFYAKKLHITTNYLSIVVKQQTGSTVQQWCRQRITMEAKMCLKHSKSKLATIATALGFSNAAQFGTFFKKETGMTPMEYRRKGV